MFEAIEESEVIPWQSVPPLDQRIQDFLAWLNREIVGQLLDRQERDHLIRYKAKQLHLVVAFHVADHTLEIDSINEDPRISTPFLTQMPFGADKYDDNKIKVLGSPGEAKDKHYKQIRAALVQIYGEKLGTFLANRSAKMIKRSKSRFVVGYGICEIGNTASEQAYAAAHIGFDRFSLVEQEFEFKQFLRGTRRFRIGFKRF